MYITARNEAKQLLQSITDDTKIIPKLYKDKNKEFIKMYNVTSSDIRNIIKNLTLSQFRKRIECKDKKFDIDYLYDFNTIYYSEDDIGMMCIVPIYVKIGRDNLTNDTIIVVSLHDDE